MYERHGHCADGKTTKEYRTYRHILERCYKEKTLHYDRYGGRGIICEYESFTAFLDDVGLAPSPKHTLDRIDNDGNYASGNCRWVTWNVQARNKPQTRWFSMNGRVEPMTVWAKIYNVSAAMVYQRLKNGWAFDESLFVVPEVKGYTVYWREKRGWIASTSQKPQKQIGTFATEEEARQAAIAYVKQFR